MELGHKTTVVALRAAVRLAWGIARTARTLGDLRERLEAAVEYQALRRQVDFAEVLEPLTAEHCAT